MRPPEPRPVTALLTALAVIASAWPLNTLLQEPTWMLPTFTCVLTVAAVGVVCRWLRWPAFTVPLAQVALAGACFLAFFPGTYNPFVRLIPGAPEFDAWSALFTEAFTTLRVQAAPVETTPSVQAILTVGIAGVAVWCDALAVTWRMPALSALPLMVPFLTAVANSDHPLPWYHPTLVVIAWMLTLFSEEGTAHRSAQTLRAWKHAPGVALSMVVALSCVAASSLVAPLIPHPETRYLVQGLGRGPNGGKGTRFDPSTDLAKDLRNQSPAAVLSYRTDDPRPGPLRIAVSSKLENGVWKRDDLAAVPSSRPVLPYPVGVEGNTPQKKYTLSVLETSLESPLLATPSNVVGGTVTGAQWGIDARTGVAVTDVVPVRYEVSYISVDVDAVRKRQKTLGTPGGVDEGAAAGQRGESLAVGDQMAAYLDRVLPTVTAQSRDDYTTALAIQNWLRSTGGFTYSLELGDAPTGPDASSDSSMLRFFSSKKGYCVHFASAMVMMAMWASIPARFVTGFLPGTPVGDTWKVKASDAHAWPELLLPGMGWTRFEPTPAGATPAYAPAPSPRTTAPSASPSANPSQRPDREPNPAPSTTGSTPSVSDSGWSLSIPSWLQMVMLGVLIVGVFAGSVIAFLMLLAQRLRRRRLHQALAPDSSAEGGQSELPREPEDEIPAAAPIHPPPGVSPETAEVRRRAAAHSRRMHAVWDNLADDLEDLGVPRTVNPTATGRLNHYSQTARLDDQGTSALRTVVDEVEDALYAASPRACDVTEHSSTVVHCAAAAATPRARFIARWFPLSGRREAQRLLTQAVTLPSRRNRHHAERPQR